MRCSKCRTPLPALDGDVRVVCRRGDAPGLESLRQTGACGVRFFCRRCDRRALKWGWAMLGIAFALGCVFGVGFL